MRGCTENNEWYIKNVAVYTYHSKKNLTSAQNFFWMTNFQYISNFDPEFNFSVLHNRMNPKIQWTTGLLQNTHEENRKDNYVYRLIVQYLTIKYICTWIRKKNLMRLWWSPQRWYVHQNLLKPGNLWTLNGIFRGAAGIRSQGNGASGGLPPENKKGIRCSAPSEW